jgi:5-methylcytosine-specific restriction protein A
VKNPITRTQYERAYELGRRLFEGSLGISDAQDQLAILGVNTNSAADLIYNVGHLLRGERYTRTLSIEVTDAYLEWIGRDYPQLFDQALSSLRKHIHYYESANSVSRTGLRSVLLKHERRHASQTPSFISPEETSPEAKHREGTLKTVLVNVYERNAKAREKCIEHYGARCSVCEFDFEKKYGRIGRGFIHVHHLKDIASIGEEYEVDPRKDLRPVCPNCHAMLHTRRKPNPPYSIEELKMMMVLSGLMQLKLGSPTEHRLALLEM